MTLLDVEFWNRTVNFATFLNVWWSIILFLCVAMILDNRKKQP